MEILIFTNQQRTITREFERFPGVIYDSLGLVTEEQNWATKFGNCIINFHLEYFNDQNQSLGSTTRTLVPFVNQYATQPILWYNFAGINFDDLRHGMVEDNIDRYVLTISLSENAVLEDDESVGLNACFTLLNTHVLDCNANLSYWVYITDNHPRVANNGRSVLILPIRRTGGLLDATGHLQRFYTHDSTDEMILDHLANDPELTCNDGQ